MRKALFPAGILLPVFCLLFTTFVFAQPTFINKVPIPYKVGGAGPGSTLKVVMHKTTHKFNPGNPSSPLNGTIYQPNGITTSVYNQKDSVGRPGALTILGPTLYWYTQDSTFIELTNKLPDPTTTHWHGAEIPARMDGGPHQVIDTGVTWTPRFKNLDKTSTLWYHPHLHDETIEQVSHGLSGMIFSQQAVDPIGNVLPRTYGVDDVPLILGDFGLYPDTLGFDVGTGTDSIVFKITDFKDQGKRPYNMVNGVTNPYLEVPAHWVRLRILNGSTRKGIQFGVSDAYDALGKIPFTLVATDGGYTIDPDTMHTLLTGPGSRNEILLNLTGLEGTTIYLSNMKQVMSTSVVGSPQGAGGGGGGKDSTSGNAFLQLRIRPAAAFPGYTPVTNIPTYKSEWEPEVRDTFGISFRREKKLLFLGGGQGFTIDGTPYEMMVINDTICLGAKEVWTINNQSPVAHPFHIHKIFFRVLDIRDSMNNLVDLRKYGLNGPKDDAMVLPGWKLRFMAKFDDFPSPINPHECYMYHCHILTHEDAVGGGMMHQFVVTDNAYCFRDPSKPVMELALYPNPTSGEVFLRGVSSKNSTVRIFDRIGRLMREQQLEPFVGGTPLNIEGLISGVYLVNWINSKGTFTGKLVIMR